MLIGLILLATFSLAWLMTWGLRRYALAHNVLDVPNSRSSHQVPTPRGGGMAIVVACSLALVVLALSDLLPAPLFYALSGSGALVALVGFVDDHRPLAARWRLLAHFLAATWGLFWLGGDARGSDTGCWRAARLVVGAAGAGLSGLAAQSLQLHGRHRWDCRHGGSLCLPGGAILYALAGRYEMVLLPVLLALACAGFLFWNFPLCAHLHGGCRQWLSGVAARVVLTAGRMGCSGAVLVLADSAGGFHSRC